ncbi:MAG: hypothetical protein EA368_00475 [Leptolyngbya sp. DLM2.Bin27]|nr:MAG: hypothetical protein EA368_00475 [Leptolyngbya sp. DLM2.Bin27]
MNISHGFAIATVLGICGLPLQAVASPQELQTNPLTMADALAVGHHSPDHLSSLADKMGRQVGPQATSETNDFLESLNIPLLSDLLDESGEFRMPLGLTVYDAMGTTSVGFGTTF